MRELCRHSAPIPFRRRALALAALAGALTACGGGADTQQLPQTQVPPPASYSGPAPATADVQAFMVNLWENVRPGKTAGCGSCHGVSQNPLFARDDDVNLAYAAVGSYVNLASPAESPLVTKVAGGHNCWLTSTQACADILTTWIEGWAGGSDGDTKQIELKAPADREVGSSRSFPADPALFQATVYPLLVQYCAGCHSGTGQSPQQPYFADEDLATAYAAARPKIELDDPATSRLVLRLRDEFHNCWSDCASNATEMENAIRAFAQQVPVTEVDPQLVISKALTLYDGIVASGGDRYEANQIALWEFKAGLGTTAFDTSGVEPAINLQLSGDVRWVGGWGIDIRSGKAQGSTAASRKLRDLIQATGEYSIEGWVVPGNVAQEDARIISYSAGTQARNFTLGQTLYNYDFFGRSTSTDGNGTPALSTADADEDLQATLQHVVVTFDPVQGRRIYVNGVFTDDLDPAAGSTLGEWDDTFALVLGNEVSGDRQWAGVLRLVAIHNRALAPEQIQGNFEAGVGEKFFLLFNVSTHVGLSEAYILFEVSQFDSYGYLFNAPVFVSLDPGVVPDDIALAGMRLGVNGAESPVGQAYRNLDLSLNATDYVPGAGQPLSALGTVIGLEKGPDSDEFFLSFERLGSSTNVVTEPTPLAPAPVDGAPRPDIGLKVFDEINATMAAVTGVPATTPAVRSTYALVRQQLPVVEDIETFVSAQQVGISQLAIEYCSALVDDPARRAGYFPSFDFSAPAAQAFDTPAERDLVLVPLVSGVMGQNLASQPDEANVRLELDNLINTLTACGAGCAPDRTETVVKAVCSSVLGSAVMLIQ